MYNRSRLAEANDLAVRPAGFASLAQEHADLGYPPTLVGAANQPEILEQAIYKWLRIANSGDLLLDMGPDNCALCQYWNLDHY